MGCSSMHSISTLLKRISLIERVIDIDDCLTMFIHIYCVNSLQCISLSFPAPYLFGVMITFFRPLFVCFFIFTLQ